MDKIKYTEDSLYKGIVTHTRFSPFQHKFKYRVTYFWFDLNEFRKRLFFKKNQFSLFSFYDKDHGEVGAKKINFCNFINKEVERRTKQKFKKIKVMCLPRILGYVFNPISVFVFYDQKLNPKQIVFEVSNTFKERHAYLKKIKKTGNTFRLKKKFYVSPFFNIDGEYEIKFNVDRNLLNLFILYRNKNSKIFSASFKGKFKRMTNINILKTFISNSFQNLIVTFGIYYQALKLFTKGATYVNKPDKPKKFFS